MCSTSTDGWPTFAVLANVTTDAACVATFDPGLTPLITWRGVVFPTLVRARKSCDRRHCCSRLCRARKEVGHPEHHERLGSLRGLNRIFGFVARLKPCPSTDCERGSGQPPENILTESEGRLERATSNESKVSRSENPRTYSGLHRC
jgi:hypothetical protein